MTSVKKEVDSFQSLLKLILILILIVFSFLSTDAPCMWKDGVRCTECQHKSQRPLSLLHYLQSQHQAVVGLP
jgi:hypothetical protein